MRDAPSGLTQIALRKRIADVGKRDRTHPQRGDVSRNTLTIFSYTLARALAQKLTESFGRAAVIKNRAGAGGIIGPDVVEKSAPDGDTR